MTDYAKHAEMIESKVANRWADGTPERRSLTAAIEVMQKLSICKAKLARVEALIAECDEGDDSRVDVDQLRAALADSGEKT